MIFFYTLTRINVKFFFFEKKLVAEDWKMNFITHTQAHARTDTDRIGYLEFQFLFSHDGNAKEQKKTGKII